MNKRLFFHVYSQDKTIDIDNCLIEYNNASNSLTLKWKNQASGFFNEMHFCCAWLEHIDNKVIIFNVAEQIGKNLTRLFC